MSSIIAEYYADELTDWNHIISFCNSEKEEMESRLAEVIQRNTVPNIAAKVETEQEKLSNIMEKFNHLSQLILNQLAKLKTDRMLIDDTLINTDIEKIQNELRRAMQTTEKEYVDVKYGCTNFILGTLKR